jgi:hypothetical protein
MLGKIQARQYVNWNEVVRDFELICSNAMKYNQKRSRIHKLVCPCQPLSFPARRLACCAPPAWPALPAVLCGACGALLGRPACLLPLHLHMYLLNGVRVDLGSVVSHKPGAAAAWSSICGGSLPQRPKAHANPLQLKVLP